MKRIILLLSLLSYTIFSFAIETKKVAILEVVDREGKLSYHQKLMLRARLAEEVNKSVGFEAYDRSNIDAIMSEHDFQRTGIVSPDQIRKLGEMAGATYILVIESAVSSQGNLFVSTFLLNVETGKIAVSANENMIASENGMEQGCASLAKKLFGELKAISDAEFEEQTKYYVTKKKAEYIYMDDVMDEKTYAMFLKANCQEAYKKYMKSSLYIKTGWSLFSIGMAAIIGGGAGEGIATLQYTNISNLNRETPEFKMLDNQYNTYIKLCAIAMVIGGATIVTSIPLVCIGYAKKKESIKIYNNQCASQTFTPITVNLTTGQNGLGIAVNF